MNNELREWQEADNNLRLWKDKELKARKKVLEMYPGGYGTQHTQGPDFKLTVVRSTTRSIDIALLDSLWDSLTNSEKECIQYTPKLDVKTYNSLPANCTLSKAITVKDSLPVVKLEVYDDVKTDHD